MLDFFDKLGHLLDENIPFVQVTVVDTQGSVPQHAGSKMLVTKEGLYHGTVGGGKVEKRALEEAMELLQSASILDPKPKRSRSIESTLTRHVEWSLSKDIGMTCGGSVKFYFEVHNVGAWNITVFGAGHVANALVKMLEKLDCRITCFDTRDDWLEKLTDSRKVKKVLSSNLPSEVVNIPDNSFVILVTMGHSTDKPILIEIFKQWEKRQFPYIGVIGSEAKSRTLKNDLEDAGLSEEYKSMFYCPMGLPIGSNHPQEIAISIVAQLLEIRDKGQKVQ